MNQLINQDHKAASLEWPKDGKWLWGPDGNRARFDSPSDVPRDYSETRPEPKLAPSPERVVAPPAATHVSPELIAAVKAMVLAEIKAEQAEKMARARAAKAPKA